MSASTGIEWTDATWNPVTGCTRVSPGCAHCYIERTPPFRMEGRRFSSGKDGGTTGVRLHPDRLEQPLHWRRPRRVFVNSLSDLFHEDVPARFIFDVFEIMGRAPQHTFQVLTKRPERALQWFRSFRTEEPLARIPKNIGISRLVGTPVAGWPLPNVWLGVSIENARFTWRADVLREIPAAVRFISAEPLLGSLFEARRTVRHHADGYAVTMPGHGPLDLTGISWVIVGGESGPGARPMHPDWAREIRDACLRSRTAFFFKQWGEWASVPDGADWRDRMIAVTAEGRYLDSTAHDYPAGHEWMERVGKKRAGRLLDGREWNEVPGRP